MWSKTKLPMGIIALGVVSLFGFKDTGILINEHVQKTYTGNEIEFSIGEKVEVIEKKADGYLVNKGSAKVTVPQDKILMTELDLPTYQITEATPLLDGQKVIRNLFVGEYAIHEKDLGEYIRVKLNDGSQGNVKKSALKKIADKRDAITEAKVIKSTQAKGPNTINLKTGDTVNVVSYESGNFVIKDTNNNKYLVDAKALDIVSGQKVEKTQNLNPLDADEKEIEQAARVSKVSRITPVSEKSSKEADRIIDSARSKLGSTYVYGATGDGGYDCSGLIYSIYVNEMGLKLPRSSREQSECGMQVDRSQLQKGDLVFFNTFGSGVSHVGIYIGNDKFIHASSGQGKVITSSLSEGYYDKRFLNATRVI